MYARCLCRTGDRGGAAEVAGARANLNVTNSMFMRNTASIGGAVSTEALFDIFVDTTIFFDNNATQEGGAFASNGTAQNIGATGLLFTDVQFTNCNSEGNGGAVSLFDKVDGVAEFLGCVFTNNRAINSDFTGNGGAIFVDLVNPGSGTELLLQNSTTGPNRFIENEAGIQGGAICSKEARFFGSFGAVYEVRYHRQRLDERRTPSLPYVVRCSFDCVYYCTCITDGLIMLNSSLLSLHIPRHVFMFPLPPAHCRTKNR